MTGATGFAGGHLLERLTGEGRAVHAVGRRPPRSTEARSTRPRNTRNTRNGAVTWSFCDLLDREGIRELIARTRPAVIFHCAGQPHVQDAWSAPAGTLRVNAMGTHNLIDACRDAGIAPRLLITGSAQIYRPQPEAITEESAIAPPNPYGISKVAQEMMASGVPMPIYLARPFNHAGPRQSPAFASSAFAQQLAEIEAGTRDPVLHVGNLEARRDLTDVRDTVRAYQAIVDAGVPHRPYNVCSGRAHSMREILDMLLSLTRARVRIEVDPARLRPSDNPVMIGSHARLTADTGWRPEIPIEQTLADLLDYWRRQ